MAKSMTTAKLINKTAHKIARKTRAVVVSKTANLPTYDIGYQQRQEFSAHRNGYNLCYKALHALTLLNGAPVTWPEIADLLASAPRCGGYAFFIKRQTVKRYMFDNRYGLWRKLDRTREVDGRKMALFVASGLTTTGQKRADFYRHRGAKIQATMVW